MGFFTKKDPCAICGGKVSGLFVSKVEGKPICKECYGNVDISAEVSPLTMEQFRAYRQFRAENQQLKERFHTTEHIDFGFFGMDFVFDLQNRWFCLDPNLNRTIFEGGAIKSFVIREGDRPIFEGSPWGFRRYESNVPDRIANMVPLIDRYCMEMETQRNLERMHDERRRREPDAPPPPPPSRPRIDLPKPFEQFHVEIILQHPYWKFIKTEKTAPSFDGTRPDADAYMREYWEGLNLMERLAIALKETAFPNAPEWSDTGSTAGNVTGNAAGNVSAAPTDAAAEIRKYKELLDQKIITEAEFTAKKRQLLGI